MSCYEYEYGSLKLPSKAFSAARRTLAENYNAWLDSLFLNAEKLYEPIKAQYKKEKAHSSLESCVEDFLYSNTTFNDQEVEIIRQALISYKEINGSNKSMLIKPKKKSFKHVKLSENIYHNDDCSLVFCDKDKTLKWDVSENNHAIQHAKESFLGKQFLKLINTIEWTRNTGGVLYYNNEYIREESDFSGAGGDRASAYIGPAGKKEQENELKFLNKQAKLMRNHR